MSLTVRTAGPDVFEQMRSEEFTGAMGVSGFAAVETSRRHRRAPLDRHSGGSFRRGLLRAQGKDGPGVGIETQRLRMLAAASGCFDRLHCMSRPSLPTDP